MLFRKSVLLTIFTLTIILLTLPAHAGVLYVKEGGTGNGASWDQAFGDPQEAIELAAVNDNYSQVWVAAGTYKPIGHPNTSGFRTREAHFSLRNGVAVYGGFAGNETELLQRDYEINQTIFSGDIGVVGDNSDNVYTVFLHPEGSNLDESALLNGVIITEGNANGEYPYDQSGGMYNLNSGPTLTNVTISNNTRRGIHNYSSSPNLTNVTISNNSGNGMSNQDNSNPTLTNVTISNNSGGIYNYSSSPNLNNVTISNNSGSGMYNQDNSNPTLTNVTISNNSGRGMYNSYSSPTLTNVTISGNTVFGFFFAGTGGGIHNFSSSPILTNVTISGNTAQNGEGGGIYNSSSNPILTNVTISGNSTSSNGGGIYNDSSSPTLTNVTISGNTAENGEGGGIYHTNNSKSKIVNCTIYNNTAIYGGGMLNTDSSPIIMNSIFWGNAASNVGDEYINEGDSSPNVSWSIFQGGYPEGNNIFNEDPHFQTLADNGGFTKTHAIPSNSPAYAIPESAGGGNWNDAPDIDQREIPRATRGFRAMGAYEDMRAGSLQIHIAPQEAADSGAQWRIQGTQTWYYSGETVQNLPVGTYTIEFRTVPGWRPIESIGATIRDGEIAQYTGSYEEFNVVLPGVLMLLLDEE